MHDYCHSMHGQSSELGESRVRSMSHRNADKIEPNCHCQPQLLPNTHRIWGLQQSSHRQSTCLIGKLTRQ